MKRVNSTLLNISGLLMLVMTLLAFIQVITRYAIELPLPWVEELIRYMMITMIFIASGVAVYRREHFNIDALDLLLKKSSLNKIDGLRQLFVILFSCVYGFLSVKFIVSQIEVGQVSPAMQISMGWPHTALLIGSVLALLNGAYLVVNSKKNNQVGGLN